MFLKGFILFLLLLPWIKAQLSDADIDLFDDATKHSMRRCGTGIKVMVNGKIVEPELQLEECHGYHIKIFRCCPERLSPVAKNFTCFSDRNCTGNAKCAFAAPVIGVQGLCMDLEEEGRPYIRSGLRPYNRKAFRRFNSTLGKSFEWKEKTCNHAQFLRVMYKEVGLRPLTRTFFFWDYWLMCPFDRENMDRTWVNDILFGSQLSEEFLDGLCLFTPNIESCGPDNKCHCYQALIRNPTRGNLILNFTQETEGHECGQTQKNPCAHDIRSLVVDYRDFTPYCDKVGKTHVAFENILEPLQCEKDAGCWNEEKKTSALNNNPQIPAAPCNVYEKCVCECARGYECRPNKKNQGTTIKSDILILLPLILYWHNAQNNYSNFTLILCKLFQSVILQICIQFQSDQCLNFVI